MKSQLKTQLQNLNQQISQLENQLNPLVNQRRDLNRQILELDLAELLPLDPAKVTHTPQRVFDTDRGYQELQKYMSQFQYVSSSGFWSHTQKKALRIALDQTQPLANQVQEILTFLPHMPLDKFEGSPQPVSQKETNLDFNAVKVFSIFEYTLSSRACYYLVVDKDNYAGLVKNSYGLHTVVKTAPVEEMIQYIYEHHPYKQNEDDSDYGHDED